ncbi:MAG: hypothetical protein ABJM29_14175 [Rhizobiaceae bacterium]
MRGRAPSKLCWLTLVAIPFIVSPSQAQQNPEPIRGWQNNRNFCQIVLVEPGLLRPSVDSMALSSKSAGGRAGVVEVTTGRRRRHRIVIDQATGFSRAPAQGNSDVSMTTSFSGQGATNFGERQGNLRRRLRRGTTRIETHMEAKRLTDPFPAGEYGAELTIRCE